MTRRCPEMGSRSRVTSTKRKEIHAHAQPPHRRSPSGDNLNRLDGANCADLPAFVIDKYFNCHANREPLRAAVARAICSNCVVIDGCREQAINGLVPPTNGIVGGVSVHQIRSARSWRRYELGLRDTPPTGERPDWLRSTEATDDVERMRLGEDPDEPDFVDLHDGHPTDGPASDGTVSTTRWPNISHLGSRRGGYDF